MILTGKRKDGRPVLVEATDEGPGPGGLSSMWTTLFVFDCNEDHWVRCSVPSTLSHDERFERDQHALENAGIDTSSLRFPEEEGGELVWPHGLPAPTESKH